MTRKDFLRMTAAGAAAGPVSAAEDAEAPRPRRAKSAARMAASGLLGAGAAEIDGPQRPERG